MPTVEIPAQNVTSSELEPVTVVGGATALEATDTDTYVEMTWRLEGGASGGGVGGPNFRIGYDDSPDIGFGAVTLPSGATVTSVKVVAYAYRTDGDVTDPGTASPYEEDPEAWPSIGYTFSSELYAYYNVGPLPLGSYGWADSDVDPADWPGVLSGDNLTSLRFFVGPTMSGGPIPQPDGIFVRVAYLALRVTYEVGGGGTRRVRPLRQHPRSDGYGLSSAPRIDGNRSMQASLRRSGGTYS